MQINNNPINSERRRSAPFHADSSILKNISRNNSSSNLSSMPGLQHNAKRQLKNTRRPMPNRKHDATTAHKKIGDIIPVLKENTIRIIPLGGVEEVGKNMTIIEYKDDIIVIDAGIQFKTEDTPGIDYILPNTKYLEERKGKIKA